MKCLDLQESSETSRVEKSKKLQESLVREESFKNKSDSL